MKTRILTGTISAVLFLTVLILPWPIVLTVVTSLLAAIAVYEVFSVADLLKNRGLESVAMVFAAIAPFFNKMSPWAITITCIVYVAMLVLMVLMYNREVSYKKTVPAFVLSAAVTLALSCMSYLRDVRDHGLFYVILALLMAWMSDTGAYFTGTFFGKHKLCPKLSPKKTVEGLVGGILTSVFVSMAAAVVYQLVIVKATAQVNYFGVLLLALVCAPLSVAGDLAASFIKRVCDVKDFGKLFPGHGGVLDRFDSLLPVFPLVYAVALWLPIVV